MRLETVWGCVFNFHSVLLNFCSKLSANSDERGRWPLGKDQAGVTVFALAVIEA